MVFTASGRSPRVVALLLLLCSVWTSSHRQQDDDACLPVVAGEHDASKHAYAPLEAGADEHCAICHWMRAVKPAFAPSSVASTPLLQGDSIPAPAPFSPAAPSACRLPARAPPLV